MEGSRVDLLSGTHGKEDQRRILLYRKGTEAIDQQFLPQLPKLDKRRQMSEVQDAYFMGRPHLYANMENMGRARENRRPQTAHRFRKDRTRRRPTRTAAKSDRTKRKINGNFTPNHTGRRRLAALIFCRHAIAHLFKSNFSVGNSALLGENAQQATRHGDEPGRSGSR